MGSSDWFRNESWDDSIEAAFFAKLKRARDKAQYLVIQAGTLVSSHPKVALRLFEKYFELDDQFNQSRALEAQARAYLRLGDVPRAVTSYERALDAEQRFPHVITQSYVDLPYLVATHGIVSSYERVLALLSTFRDRPKFPVEHFKWHASRALILSAQGNRDDSQADACEALSWAKQEQSGFRYHQGLGLVGAEHSLTKSRLTKLCNA
jgi:tetratricopeptide (TPR) repeat protein